MWAIFVLFVLVCVIGFGLRCLLVRCFEVGGSLLCFVGFSALLGFSRLCVLRFSVGVWLPAWRVVW